MAAAIDPEAMSCQVSTHAGARKLRVAYLMSRFPKLTETFVLYEILALRELGVDVEVYPLLRARNTSTHTEGGKLSRKIVEFLRAPNTEALQHAEVAQLQDCTFFLPLISWSVVLANIGTALTRPLRYFGLLAKLIRSNLGSARFLLAGLAFFPKTVAVARILEERGIDHVHAHFANHPAAAAFMIHRIAGIPFSFTAHGSDIHVDQHMLADKIRESSFVVTVSEYNRQFMIEHGAKPQADKIKVIRCGIDPSAFMDGTPVARERDREPLRILCIGTFYEVKGHPHLLEACRLLADSGMEFECRLIGDGPDKAALEDQVRTLGLTNQVEFCGVKTRDAVISELHRTDILAVPSVLAADGRREGIPVVCIEGMAAGVVVVASSISGIPELIEQDVDGLLVTPGDPEALAEAFLRVYRETGLKARLGDAAQRRIARDYDLSRNALTLLESIRATLNS